MKGSRNYSRRFFVQSLVLFLVMSLIAFLGVYTSGATAYRSANRLGSMTADYLSTQVDALLEQYDQILEDAAYMVNAMVENGSTANEIENWITAFSQEYNETMQYDESGLYGVIRGQGVFSSGWNPDESYDMTSRSWYQQALQAGGTLARSQVYKDARTGTTMISLSKLLSDGESVLALDIRVGDIQVEWQEGSDVFPGTATVVDQDGNVVLHQKIGQDHAPCELDDFTQDDYQALLSNLSGERGMYRWDGEQDRYQMYYIRTDGNWTFLVTIPRSVITYDATVLFYVQLSFLGVFLLIILYLSLRNYRVMRQNRQVQQCLEAVGQTYYCMVQVDAARNRCDVLKLSILPEKEWAPIKTYEDFLAVLEPTLYREEDRAQFRETFALPRLQDLRHRSGRLYMEYERRGEGGPRWVSAEALTAPDSSGQEPVILAFRQIHETKCAELEKNRILRESLSSARQANQAKSDFLSRMSHDMRTPMNAVIGFATMAKQYHHDPERVDDCLTKITAASQQLLHLINEVLDTAKIEQGKMELRPAPMDLRRHVEETAALFRLQTEAQHQQFTLVEPTLTHEWVLLDGSRLDQILNNLLSNAVKYTPAGGSITLQVEELPTRDDGMLLYRFTVSDTGIGMAPEFLDRLFLPFEREDTSMTGKVSGVGLGMAITRHMVQMMGGHIEVSSTQGEGSIFTILLPCPAAEQSPDSTSSSSDSDAPFTLEGLHFLLAEDNMLNREIAQELLQMEGATVFPVENGQEAVEAFQNAPPGTFDAILMDIQMPVLDGYGATKAIRALSRKDAATIPIFAMTANAFEDDILAARQAGMNGHIAKPVDMDRMRTVLAAGMPPKPKTNA